ncbi:MAG: hypothetical protein L0Z48_03560 [candidate division Zixibacteria bacterium]|nr:hypothetical protein [candidate division Zixibacteria bacterium]
MFLRKMEGRQIVAGLLVAALLVLAAVNVTGLIQGREAVKKAEARYLKLNVDFGGKGDDTQGGCPNSRFNCIYVSWGAPGQNVTLSTDGL